MKIVIVGAGPTGLGAAVRLNELKQKHNIDADVRVLEAADGPGGLAASVRDTRGFLWDLGGHVIFSHYRYFDDVLDSAVGRDGFYEHRRVSDVRMRGTYIPYPLQNNIHCLPRDEFQRCLKGLLECCTGASAHCSSSLAPFSSSPGAPMNFETWIKNMYGDALAQTFMMPYNFKVWAYPPAQLSSTWVGERVARVDVAKVVENAVCGRVDAGWGPNSRFRFPKTGGTGAIWRAVAEKCTGSATFSYNTRATSVHVDDAHRFVLTSAGEKVYYDALINTSPLDTLCATIDTEDAEVRRRLQEDASELFYSSTHVVGLGFLGEIPAHLRERCWIYFPENSCPFYRATCFSNYSPDHVPPPGRDTHSALKNKSQKGKKFGAQVHGNEYCRPLANNESRSFERESAEAFVALATKSAAAKEDYKEEYYKVEYEKNYKKEEAEEEEDRTNNERETRMVEEAGSGAKERDCGGNSRSSEFDDNEEEKNQKQEKYWSLMCEVSESAQKPVDCDSVVQECIDGAVASGIIDEACARTVVSTWHRQLRHGYPTPSVGRDRALRQIEPTLRKRFSIWSRGRFGGWKYEVGNQDHCFMQGVEAVDNILFGVEEQTIFYPDHVNDKTRETTRTYASESFVL